MKRIILVFVFFPLFAFSQQKLELQVSNISKTQAPNELKYMKNNAFYDIELSLKNNSYYLSTLFWGMSCSWSDHFIFAQENFYLLVHCKSNGPVRYFILPRTIIKFKGVLCTPGHTTMEELKNMQVGFVFCDGQTLSRDTYCDIRHYDSMEIIKAKYGDSFDIIWNYIRLGNMSLDRPSVIVNVTQLQAYN